jgi:hypothetical protein
MPKDYKQDRQVCVTLTPEQIDRIDRERDGVVSRATVVREMVRTVCDSLDVADDPASAKVKRQRAEDEQTAAAFLQGLNDHLVRVIDRDPEYGVRLALRSGAHVTAWASARAVEHLGASPDDAAGMVKAEADAVLTRRMARALEAL